MSSSTIPFVYPAWATAGEERKKYGKAKALGASAQTLDDKDDTEGFLEARAMGEIIDYHFSLLPAPCFHICFHRSPIHLSQFVSNITSSPAISSNKFPSPFILSYPNLLIFFYHGR